MLKTTSQPVSEKLVKAGWVEETHAIYCLVAHKWSIVCEDLEYWKVSHEWLPAPTTDEIAEGVSFADMLEYYPTEIGDEHAAVTWWELFSRWLYTTRNSADRMAEVWIVLKGKEITNAQTIQEQPTKWREDNP